MAAAAPNTARIGRRRAAWVVAIVVGSGVGAGAGVATAPGPVPDSIAAVCQSTTACMKS
ncbi:hypothetical protein BH23ACT10_BH23ACT10_27570 [soil metagenome]